MESSRQEYWSGLTFPSPGDLPHPEIEPRSPALKADCVAQSNQVSPITFIQNLKIIQMNACAKQDQSHRYRTQASGYQMGERSGEGQFWGREFRDTNYHINR